MSDGELTTLIFSLVALLIVIRIYLIATDKNRTMVDPLSLLIMLFAAGRGGKE